jgi:hypothetical protein
MQNYRINRAFKNATEVHSKNIYNIPLTFINNYVLIKLSLYKITHIFIAHLKLQTLACLKFYTNYWNESMNISS